MSQRVCLVHYHEIGLKGKNRSTFENQLVNNLHRALRGHRVDVIRRVSGHILVTFQSKQATDEDAAAIAQVPGVARVSCGYKCERNMEEMGRAAVDGKDAEVAGGDVGGEGSYPNCCFIICFNRSFSLLN